MTVMQMDDIPQFYCALELFLDSETDAVALVNSLHHIGIGDAKIHRPKAEAILSVNCVFVNNERFWHLDEALNKMFSKLARQMSEIKEIIVKFNASARIDIAFYQYGTFPSLELTQQKLQLIHDLNADISIDPYCC